MFAFPQFKEGKVSKGSSASIVVPIIMSIATVHASSLLPSKRKCAVYSARLVGRRKYTSTAMLRIMSGRTKL